MNGASFVNIYTDTTKALLKQEFKQNNNICYLDHAGATLYSSKQLSNVFEDLQNNTYANPHSRSITSKLTEDAIDQVRYQILEHFGTTSEEYTIIFTSGATQSLKHVAETFVYHEDINNESSTSTTGTGTFCHLSDNHTSVLGMRQFAANVESLSVTNAFEIFQNEKSVEINNAFGEENSKFDDEKSFKKNRLKYKSEKNSEVEESNSSIPCKNEKLRLQNYSKFEETDTYKNGNTIFEETRSECRNHPTLSTLKTLKSENITNLKDDDGNSQIKEIIGSQSKSTQNNSLFVYPAQCNFTGTKYPLDWIEKVQKGYLTDKFSKESGNWYCLLDAASFVSTSYLDLGQYKPDFVCISFYKMFGYPSGLGALIVKNSSAHLLKKKYFGGGTVLMALAEWNVMVPREKLYERFEDGTLPFLSIIALRHGFETFKRLHLSMPTISIYTYNLAKYVYDTMRSLHHSNGRPLCNLYNDSNFDGVDCQGPIINFNVLRPTDGEYVGYAEVLNISNLFGVQLRTGCFCNPGACQRHLNLTSEDIQHQFKSGHVCGDHNDIIDGIPTGSVRISFGYMSTKSEADAFLEMLIDCFCTKPLVKKHLSETFSCPNSFQKTILKNNCTGSPDFGRISKNNLELLPSKNDNIARVEGSLDSIFIYPVKSCASFTIKQSWKLVDKGLEYDREWMIVTNTGICLTQKQDTNLCKIKPTLDIENGSLTLHFKGFDSINIKLEFSPEKLTEASMCQSKICNDMVKAWDCGKAVSNWLSLVLNTPGLRLLRQGNSDTARCTKSNMSFSLANQAQYLLVNTASIKWLHDMIPADSFHDTLESMIQRFRPNFVVNFEQPFLENELTEYTIIGDEDIQFLNDGKCTRCQMICINQMNGEKTVEPLRSLAKALNGKISFGVYLKRCDINDKILVINSKVTVA